VFCCPSIWEEPFGMVILEAMASGLPVVASSTGGIPEILQHGGGVLVEPSNPVSLAAKLKLLIVDSQLRSEKRDDAIKSVRKHFTWDLIQQHYTQIADEIAKCSGT
jgi:spore coat protein SA